MGAHLVVLKSVLAFKVLVIVKEVVILRVEGLGILIVCGVIRSLIDLVNLADVVGLVPTWIPRLGSFPFSFGGVSKACSSSIVLTIQKVEGLLNVGLRHVGPNLGHHHLPLFS